MKTNNVKKSSLRTLHHLSCLIPSSLTCPPAMDRSLPMQSWIPPVASLKGVVPMPQDHDEQM